MSIVLKIKNKEKLEKYVSEDFEYDPELEFLKSVMEHPFKLELGECTITDIYEQCVEIYEGITGREMPIGDETFIDLVADRELVLAEVL